MTSRTRKLFPAPTLIATATTALLIAACGGGEQPPATADSAQPATAASAPAANGGPQPGGPHDPARLIARFDTNQDGKLQVSELPPRAQKRLGSADANHDGVITKQEITDQMQKRADERFAKGDKNGDGKLTQHEVGARRWRRLSAADANNDQAVTQDELRAAHEAGTLGPRAGHGKRGPGRWGGKGGPGQWGGQRGPGDGTRMFARFDDNGDGKVTQDEVPPRLWEHIKVADADQDNAVTKDELKQAHDDGKLKPPARGQGRKGGKGQWGGQRGPGDGARMFARFDDNGDGKVTQDEVPPPVWDHIKVADADQDNAVTKDELKQAHDDGKLKPPARGQRGPGGKGGKGQRGPGRGPR